MRSVRPALRKKKADTNMSGSVMRVMVLGDMRVKLAKSHVSLTATGSIKYRVHQLSMEWTDPRTSASEYRTATTSLNCLPVRHILFPFVVLPDGGR